MSASGSGTIGVVGGGAWGTALAVAAARAGKQVVLWARDPAQAEAMARQRENRAKLPGVRLEEAITPTSALEALEGAQMLLIAVPAQAVRGVCEALATVVGDPLPVIVCAKGIERETKAFMTDIVRQTLAAGEPRHPVRPELRAGCGARPADRGGDRGRPMRRSRASSPAACRRARLRLYHTTDTRGVEIGGAAKNVLAIAAGIVEGRRLGDSAKAALTTRGFAELRRFATAHGAKPETLMGLSGLGDLMLSTSTPKSRNFALGLALGARRGASGRGAWQARRRRFHGKRSLRDGTHCRCPHAGQRLRGGDPRPEALDR